MRIRLEGVPYRYHEGHIAAKGMDSLSHYNLGAHVLPMPQAMKILDAKAAVQKNVEKLEKIPASTISKSTKADSYFEVTL